MPPSSQQPEGRHPSGLPTLFLDRSLGRIQVPNLLRAAGLEVITLAERYGVPADETVADSTWLAEVGSRDWVALMKDERIRRRTAEKLVVNQFAVRCFVITRADLRAEQMAHRFIDNMPAIARPCAEPGPYIFAVHETRIERLKLD